MTEGERECESETGRNVWKCKQTHIT